MQEAQISQNACLALCTRKYKDRKKKLISEVKLIVAKSGATGGPNFQLEEGFQMLDYFFGKNTQDRMLAIKHRNYLEDHFEPKVIDRYPLEDRAYYPLPVELTRYCFPKGLHLVKGNP